MARILTTASLAAAVMLVMGSVQLVAPRDGLVSAGGKAFAADMPVKAAPAPAPVGKGKAPVGKGKAPIVTKG